MCVCVLGMEGQPHSVCYVQWANEGQSNIELMKVLVYESPSREGGPRVFFQCREVVRSVGLPKVGYWHKWYRQVGEPRDLRLLCRSLDMEVSDWRPSLRQARALDLSDDIAKWCTREVNCWALVLVVHLVVWATRLTNPRRAAARKTFVDIVLKLSGAHRRRITEGWAATGSGGTQVRQSGRRWAS